MNLQPSSGQARLSSEAGGVEIVFSGAWTHAAEVPSAEALLESLRAASPKGVRLSARELQDWDSRLPTFILKISDFCASAGIAVECDDLPEGVRGLLNLARAVPERSGARRSANGEPFLARLGKNTLAAFKEATGMVGFVGETLLAMLDALRGRARYRTVDLMLCVQETGPGALAIVSLISILVGLILAFVGAVQLSMFGAQIYIADLVGLGTVREMGALMTAVIMAGRTGAAYAAQLGTMNVNSEIDALRTMGISPMQFLVLPRLAALILMMPLLCLYADLMGILGGALVTVSAFDVNLLQYYNETRRAVHLPDLAIGLSKSLVFAVLIASAGCRRGMQCGRSAAAVGEAATAAVVDSIVYIVVADSVITLVCNRLGI